MLKHITVALLACLFFASPALAQTTLKGAERAKAIQQVETYLNGITTMKADFVETHSDSTRHNGIFYLSRPGRLRFAYAPPNGDYIVADGLLVHYWDNEIKNYSNAPIGSTLADFLLRKKIKLAGDLKVINVKTTPDNGLLLSLSQTADPQAGQLDLVFDANPMRLKRWRVVDGTGTMTEVSLYNAQPNVKIDARQFVFKTPKGFESEAEKR